MTLEVTMTLLSDALLASGYSSPGGADLAACRDARGYPYLKGTALKGLLRESLENWLEWTGGDPADARAILGESGWKGQSDERRLLVTDLTLRDPPPDAERCFDLRSFTAVEDGVAKEKTLRTAMCVCRGLVFEGELLCGTEDTELLLNALACIKWVGAMSGRGFGRARVRGRVKEAKSAPGPVGLEPAGCIRLRLRTEAPVLVTDPGRSRENYCETRGFLPGSALRGMVMGLLREQMPEWFETHRRELLSDRVRFGDLVPVAGDLVPLPAIMGFYEDRAGKRFCSLAAGAEGKDLKRARLGDLCALEDGTLWYWSARTDGAVRLRRGKGEDSLPFQTRCLSAGQEFEGAILLEDPALAPVLGEVLARGPLWLGADRYEGFGKCALTLLEAAEAPRWVRAYGCRGAEDFRLLPDGRALVYLLAVSPLTMLDDAGEPCGLDLVRLARRLGVERVDILACSTAVAEYGGYNRTWQCREASVRMYERGSLFRLACSQVPDLEAMERAQREGLGIRRAEGFGQVLFLRPALLEGLERKREWTEGEEAWKTMQTARRRARMRWIMEQAEDLYRGGLSRSQAGEIQALCKKAASRGDLGELYRYFRKSAGRVRGDRFTEVRRLVDRVLNTPLKETLGVPWDEGEDGVGERLALLVRLFDFSRKDERKGRA